MCRNFNFVFTMKKVFYILATFWAALTFIFTVSCNKTITYEEMKTAENKIIRSIIADHNFEVLEEYPKSGIFGENQFVQLSSGIYLNVVDSGNGNRAEYRNGSKGGTEVLVRVSGYYYYSGTIDTFTTFTNTYPPMNFEYGFAKNVVDDHSYSYDYYNIYYLYFGTGIESILSYVGDSAIVKLIVPGYSEINSSPAGSSMQSGDGNAFIPIFFDRIRYTFY